MDPVKIPGNNCQDGETLLLLTEIPSKIGTMDLSDENLKIFVELRELILTGDSENLRGKLVEYREFPIDSQNHLDKDFTLLHHAAEKGNLKCIQVLLEFSPDPNIQSVGGFSPIHLLANFNCQCNSCGENIGQCLKALIAEGGDVDLEDDRGETPLYFAARNGFSDAAETLLSNGADINHWVDGTSVATLLAQYLPSVLKTEFDKRIVVDSKAGRRGLRLDFRLLLQEVAIHEGFVTETSSPEKRILSTGWTRGSVGSPKRRKTRKCVTKSEASIDSSVSSRSSSTTIPPRETELLNYLLRADLVAVEAVVNHPLVEAFVHLKWLRVRRLFFFLRSLYLLFMSLYTFYVFDTFVGSTCYYTRTTRLFSSLKQNGTLMMRETVEKATFGSEIPTGSGPPKQPWQTFSDYFKAHEMTCEPTLRTTVMAYLFAAYAIGVVLYELYKLCESWYDYFKAPLNFSSWILSVNIGITVLPGLGLWAHGWLYPYAAFSLLFGWILVLAQVARIPNFGVFVGIFVEVLKDFWMLLLTFSPVLLAFALGFSVMLPQHEFFQSIPLAFFKVFLMMTGDVDFWGVFRETWAVHSINEHRGYVYIPLFVIYSAFILTVTMVLMSLLLGLAVSDIQEVRREATLKRTVGLIREIGIFESIFQTPILVCCGCSAYFSRLFSITSLEFMNGPELLMHPEDPDDQKLPSGIKQKLVPYLKLSSSCYYSGERNKEEELKSTRASWRWTQPERRRIPEKVGSQNGIGSRKVGFSGRNRNVSIKGQPSAIYGDVNPHLELSRDMVHRDLTLYYELKGLLEENDKLRRGIENLRLRLINRK